jgi:hypothetical protein
MSTAKDFIPKEAEIEVVPANFQDGVANLAFNDDISEQVTACVHEYEARFSSQREGWDDETDGIWNLQDAMWRCAINDAAVQSEKKHGANEPDEWNRARVGSTLLYRQVTQKASNGYAVQTSRDMPFKYDPISDSEFEKSEHAESRAKKLNLLAKWSMKNDRFKEKSIDFWTQLYKRGNAVVMVEWLQKIGKKTISAPVFEEDGVTIKSYQSEEYDGVTVNRPAFRLIDIKSLYADTAIGNIQDQECVIVTSLVGITNIANEIRNGIYRNDLFQHLDSTHQWDGFSGKENAGNDKMLNRGIDILQSDSGTGQYMKRDIFVNLPIELGEAEDGSDSTWDILKNVPKRFRVTMIGNTPSTSVIARIERNQEPDDSIPIEIIHANPDDDNYLYHISDYEVVRSNIAVETTVLRQMIDNNTLVNKPPIIEEEGAVRGNDRSFSPDARWIADDINAIKTFDIRPLAQENIPILQYIKDDSNTANAIDKNMQGESFGARTTASEATTISGNSRRPNIVKIEYALEQLFQFYAKRLKVNWEAFGRHDQIIQITDENEQRAFIRPTNLGGEYDIVIDVVDDMKDDEVKAQRLINGAQVFSSIPQLAQQMDWKVFAEELADNVFGTTKFIVGDSDGDAVENAKRKVAQILNTGDINIGLSPNMNLKKHLEVYKEERLRWQGSEDQNPNVAALDSAIEQLENAIEQQASQGGGSQQSLAPPQSQAQLQQQLTSGALGGIQ